MHDQRPILPGTPEWDAERELIETLQACPACNPTLYRLCPTHERAVDAMYSRCEQPDCPACRRD